MIVPFALSPRAFWRIAEASLLLLVAAVASAADGPAQAPDRSAWESGFHVVRPGDTMEGLALRYLGSETLWREIATLNPEVPNPHFILPGERLRIFLDRPTPQPSAQIVALSRRVEERPQPVPWRAASEGDVLIERDGLRTYENSSAGLRFDDGAALTLAQESLVFIRRQTAAAAGREAKKEIEIQVGQADVASSIETAAGGEIDVIVGGARGAGRAEAGKPLRARSRKTAEEQAQFMVYEGASTVSAAGKKVELAAGSGTTVPPKAAPGPAETLLEAPGSLSPASGEEIGLDAPDFAWGAVPGAAGYLLEICRDATCGAMVARRTIGPEAHSRVDGSLEPGVVFWRVTAIAPSGLDGFPSPALRVQVVESVASPAPALALRAAGAEPAGSCFATPPELAVRALDRAGRTLPWRAVLDGNPVEDQAWKEMPPGSHVAVARVQDRRGRAVDSPPVAFEVDAAAPWPTLSAAPAAPVAEAKQSRRHRRPVVAPPSCDLALEAYDPASGWSAVPCTTGPAPARASFAVTAEHPTIELRTSGRALSLGGLALAADDALTLSAWDVGCGATEIGLSISPSPYAGGGMRLTAEVRDRAGNSRVLDWAIAGR